MDAIFTHRFRILLISAHFEGGLIGKFLLLRKDGFIQRRSNPNRVLRQPESQPFFG
jgi:hypothetical protein